MKAAAANLVGIAPEADRDTVADAVAKAFGESLTPLALGAQLARAATPTATPTGPNAYAAPPAPPRLARTA